MKKILGTVLILGALIGGCTNAPAPSTNSNTTKEAAVASGKPVTVTNFANVNKDWGTWVNDGCDLKVNVLSENEVELDFKGGGANVWDIQFKTADDALFPIVRGKTYVLKFSAKAEKPRKMNVAVEEPTESSGYFKNLEVRDLALTTEYQDFTYQFKATDTYDSHLIFMPGAYGSGKVYLKNISLTLVQ